MEPTISIESVLDALREVVRTYAGMGESRVLAVQHGPIDEVWATLPGRCVRPAVQLMVEELGIWHLSTITASDLFSASPEDAEHKSAGIEVQYHFWLGRGLTLRCVLPYEAPCLESVRDLIPGAAFYEREAAEMLGITFYPAGASPAGAGDQQASADRGWFILPDDWEGGAPLRHDYQPEQES
jgi:NADH:ubiquinone oxidoreductase subunit C